MSLADQLANALESSDEQPNIVLAQKLAKQTEVSGEILELLGIVKHASKPARHDAIKVLYELASLRPSAFEDKLSFVFGLLETQDNRLLWGTLTLLAKTCRLDQRLTFEHLPQILSAAESESVIAKDATYEILLELSTSTAFQDQVRPNIIEFLNTAAPNQLPMYAEKTAQTASNLTTKELVHVLFLRLDEMPTTAKRNRLEKAIAKLSLPPKPLALA